MKNSKQRCAWCTDDPLYMRYHDEEWGRPLHDDQKLFEMLILEGAQAGLSWLTVLKKRENYRKAFDGFDAKKISRYTDSKIEKLLLNEGIIRNRLKVVSTVKNAKAFLEIQKEFGSFDQYLWSFVKGAPLQRRAKRLQDIPTKSPESDAMSRDLKKRGFNFVGSTICYAFMQAVGMTQDHLRDCFLYGKY